MNDANDKQRMSYVNVNSDSKSLLCVQLDSKTSFVLKVILEKWIASVNTVVPYILRTSARLAGRKNSSNAVTMSRFNYLSYSLIQMKWNLFCRERTLKEGIFAKIFEVITVLLHLRRWEFRLIYHQVLGHTASGFMEKFIIKWVHFIWSLVKKLSLDNFISWIHL